MRKTAYDHNVRLHTYFGISHRAYKRVRVSKVLYQTKEYDIHLFVIGESIDMRYLSQYTQLLGVGSNSLRQMT